MVNFRKDLFFQIQIFIRLLFASFLADASLGIFLVVKFLRMANFCGWHFCVDFIFAAAKYVFLTCIVPVFKIEGSTAMFPKLNLINQCDLQFLTIKWQNCTLSRILTGKKYRQIKFQRLQYVQEMQREASSFKWNSFGSKFSQVHLFQKHSPRSVLLKRCGLQLY